MMTKKYFMGNVQSKDKKNNRKTVELPMNIRGRYSIKEHVGVSMRRDTEEKIIKFFANVQAKTIKDGRKVIELPPHVRGKFKVGDSVNIMIESIEW